MNEDTKKHTISLYVSNKPGVLIRTALVFARRGYNIDSLVVSEASDPAYSRMTITGTGDPHTLDLMLKQLNKLVDVIHAKDMTNVPVIESEIALFKIQCSQENRTEILQIGTAFNGIAHDLTENSITLELTGTSEKLDTVRKVFEPYGLIEIVRSGKILISRGSSIT